MRLENSAARPARATSIDPIKIHWWQRFAPISRRSVVPRVASSTTKDISSASAAGCAPAQHTRPPIGAGLSAGQPYRLFITSETRDIAQAALSMLWSSAEESRLMPERVSLRTDTTTGRSRVAILLVCDATQRRQLAQFVHRASELRGIRRLRWETVPPRERTL